MSKILAIIGARGGSKGVPDKNIKMLCGKPLIAWSIENVLALDESITNFIVSTDSPKIQDTAKKYGADIPFIRPENLSNSTAGKFDVWKHALSECEKTYDQSYDYVLDIDCTSPLLEASDLKSFIQAFHQLISSTPKADGLITVSEARRNPYFNMVEEHDDGSISLSKTLESNIVRRQDAPQIWDIVAGFYMFKADYIRQSTYLFDGQIHPYEISVEKCFDIDTMFDFELVELLKKRQLKRI